ncbi:MAG: DUF885 domain-containing protein [Pseudomonadota bacterium]
MTEPNTQLEALAQRYWAFECFESPFSAILAGQATDDAVLFRESPQDHDRRAGRAAELLAETAALAGAELNPQDQATLTLLRRELKRTIDFHRVNAHLRPSIYPAGPDFNLVYFANSASANTVEAAELFVERLAAVGRYVEDLKAGLKKGQELGFRYPRRVLERGAGAARANASADINDSPFLGPLHRSPLRNSDALSKITAQAEQLVRGEVLPALQGYAAFLTEEIGKTARSSLACTDDPMGGEFYDLLVRQFTSLDQSADEIHELGLDEVERVGQEMAEVAADAGYDGQLEAYRAFIGTDRSFFARTLDEHLNAVLALCKRIDQHIPAYFGRIPRITYSVRCIPEELSENLPPAYAQPSPADNSAPGIYWISSDLEKYPTYLYPSIALHEAWPGHLMQIALMQEQTSLPAFRRHGALKYTACIEGWAMYCENLGVDMGVYQTPHEHMGRLIGEMWRSVRLVVDTGLHTRGWTREQATAYLSELAPMPRPMVEAEVDRYIALPGQALAYQPGNLKFRELRQRAEQQLGSAFDIRAFHDQLIAAGPVTLPVLDDLTQHWLDQQQLTVAA